MIDERPRDVPLSATALNSSSSPTPSRVSPTYQVPAHTSRVPGSVPVQEAGEVEVPVSAAVTSTAPVPSSKEAVEASEVPEGHSVHGTNADGAVAWACGRRSRSA